MCRAMLRVGIGTLCFVVKIFYISFNIPYLIFEPRLSKTGRGEGGLLCLDD
jgi:hypothetical protein